MANVGHSSTPRPIYSAVQNYRQLHPRGSIRASPIEGSGAHWRGDRPDRRRESEVLSGDNGTVHPCEFRPPSPPDHGRVTDDTPGLSLVHRQ